MMTTITHLANGIAVMVSPAAHDSSSVPCSLTPPHVLFGAGGAGGMGGTGGGGASLPSLMYTRRSPLVKSTKSLVRTVGYPYMT
jgi:uncharacterized membrane protein YfcA